MKYNEYRTGYYHFTSIENINLLQYNLKSFKEFELGNVSGDNWTDSILLESKKYTTYSEQNKYISNICRTEIKKNLTKYTIFHIACCFKAIVDPSRYDVFLFFKKEVPSHSGVVKAFNEKGFFYSISKSLGWLLTDTINSPSKGFLIANIYIIVAFVFQIGKLFFISYFLIIFYKAKKFNWNYPTIFTICFIGFNFLITGPVASPRYLIPIDFYIFCATALGFEFWINRKKAPNI
ncbi:hypothetical protein [Rhizosphaericola mali]|uniref:Uncharacterized protein n=1 Tax=Rhizosphaericola mali TaxID=2545455 RepID=A0A5P2GCH6_9BACT|nr:hypothetical protein [Rhizosphaericola mali]QES89281.1 hypothetical protein E0W69_011610 [Rhizosphaericola mali]